MKTYILPNGLRQELRRIWGVPIFGEKKEVAKKFKDFVQKRKFKKIITVGDYCSLTLFSDVKIFDGKVGREKIKETLPFSLTCLNPPGTIQEKVWPTIKKAIRENKNLFVKGEEDLLVIPSVLLAKRKTAVVYGFPGKGVCVIEVTFGIKKVFEEILEKFQTK